jgi:hypothetical protein
MSEPTQAEVKEAIGNVRSLGLTMRYECAEIVCRAAERSLTPATPTEHALATEILRVNKFPERYGINREHWRILVQMAEKELDSQAVAPPATQTGDVRKAELRTVLSEHWLIATGDSCVCGAKTATLDAYLNHMVEFVSPLLASAAPTPEPTGAETDTQWLARITKLLPEGSPVPLFYNQDGSINRQKTLDLPCFAHALQQAAQPGQKGERK